MRKFTIGSDPEIFLQSKGKAFVSAIGKIGGTKENPRPLELPGFFVQEDNVALEFNIPPATNATEFVKSLNLAFTQITEIIPKGLTISKKASGYFSKEQLADPQAMAFGCSPDYNAWLMSENPRPVPPHPQFRCCGGHVHVGIDIDDDEKPEFIKCMDLFLGVKSVLLDPDVERRSFYGKAGCFRFTPYGVEYRTLSNFWVFGAPSRSWVFHQTQRAINFYDEGNNIPAKSDLGLRIQEAINTSNKTLAQEIIAEHEL